MRAFNAVRVVTRTPGQKMAISTIKVAPAATHAQVRDRILLFVSRVLHVATSADATTPIDITYATNDGASLMREGAHVRVGDADHHIVVTRQNRRRIHA